MSVWVPTSVLEFRKQVVTIKDDSGSYYECDAMALYQKWTMRGEDGVKFQWRPIPGQGMPLAQGPLERETLEKPKMEFDPSD